MDLFKHNDYDVRLVVIGLRMPSLCTGFHDCGI